MHQSILVIQCNDVHILWKLQKSMKGKTNNWDPLFEFNFATFFPILLDTLVDLLCCCKQDFFLLRGFQQWYFRKYEVCVILYLKVDTTMYLRTLHIIRNVKTKKFYGNYNHQSIFHAASFDQEKRLAIISRIFVKRIILRTRGIV